MGSTVTQTAIPNVQPHDASLSRMTGQSARIHSAVHGATPKSVMCKKEIEFISIQRLIPAPVREHSFRHHGTRRFPEGPPGTGYHHVERPTLGVIELEMIKTFAKSESGAVTVDWVVLTAAIVGLGLAVMAVVSGGIEDLSGDIDNQLLSTNVGDGDFNVLN